MRKGFILLIILLFAALLAMLIVPALLQLPYMS